MVCTNKLHNIQTEEEKIIVFEKGIPGLENLLKYVLLTPKDSYPLYFLQSYENGKIVIPIVNPFDFLPSYSPKITDEVFEELQIFDSEDLLILNVAVIPKDKKNITVNFASPILINIKKLIAKQIVLADGDYSIRESVYNKVINLIKGGAGNACIVQEER